MQTKSTIRLSFFFLLIFTLGCSSSQQLVKFPQKAQEPFSNQNLQAFLKANPNPKIVLRVPNVLENVTSKITNEQQILTQKEKERNDIYYNAIEKELLMAGFSVRDRGLFNEVLKKMERDTKENINYSQIRELTNTDLILEVVKINPSVEYVTNKYYTVNKKNKEVYGTSSAEYKKYGASAEFKIILVTNNEMAGSYKYNYTPCLEGCPASSFKPLNLKLTTKLNSPVPYSGVEYDVMEEFIKTSAKDLIKSIKVK